jgi:FAD:protein FMN transferase
VDELNRRQMILSSMAALGAPALTPASESITETTPERKRFSFHFDRILGTSLDVHVAGLTETQIQECEAWVLAEFERFRAIFSTYDADSELSQINASKEPVAVSVELIEVLDLYDFFQEGLLNPKLGQCIEVWQKAEKSGVEPAPEQLQPFRSDDLNIDYTQFTVQRILDAKLNLNSVAKGFIIQRISEQVRHQFPEITSLIFDLGGDLTIQGEPAWVAVQDPFNPFENAKPILVLNLQNVAVATSGSYQRFYDVGGKRYSHLIDPRSGRPAEKVASATVLAANSIVAHAIATALAVLDPETDWNLLSQLSERYCCEYLLIGTDGKEYRSQKISDYEVNLQIPKDEDPTEEMPKGNTWPKDFQVRVNIELPKLDIPKYRRPYAAVWIENEKGVPVRSIEVWGNRDKYLKDLGTWWKFAKGNTELIKTVTKATRAPGKYAVVWDGKDDKGMNVPKGIYTVKVEVHREHGKHLTQTGKIACMDKPATTKLAKNAETEETIVEFGKKK